MNDGKTLLRGKTEYAKQNKISGSGSKQGNRPPHAEEINAYFCTRYAFKNYVFL